MMVCQQGVCRVDSTACGMGTSGRSCARLSCYLVVKHALESPRKADEEKVTSFQETQRSVTVNLSTETL